eukprot:scaffold301_cov393-Prasinococcus_capsulatus_cf.AAC.19
MLQEVHSAGVGTPWAVPQAEPGGPRGAPQDPWATVGPVRPETSCAGPNDKTNPNPNPKRWSW